MSIVSFCCIHRQLVSSPSSDFRSHSCSFLLSLSSSLSLFLVFSRNFCSFVLILSFHLFHSQLHFNNLLSFARNIWLDSCLNKFLKRKDNASSFKHESVVISSFGESNSFAAYVNCQFCCYMYILRIICFSVWCWRFFFIPIVVVVVIVVCPFDLKIETDSSNIIVSLYCISLYCVYKITNQIQRRWF